MAKITLTELELKKKYFRDYLHIHLEVFPDIDDTYPPLKKLERWNWVFRRGTITTSEKKYNSYEDALLDGLNALNDSVEPVHKIALPKLTLHN